MRKFTHRRVVVGFSLLGAAVAVSSGCAKSNAHAVNGAKMPTPMIFQTANSTADVVAPYYNTTASPVPPRAVAAPSVAAVPAPEGAPSSR